MADVQIGCCLVNVNDDAPLKVLVTNSSEFTQHVDMEDWAGLASDVTPVCTEASDTSDNGSDNSVSTIRTVQSSDNSVKLRQQLLSQHLFKDQVSPLPWQQKDSLLQLLLENHHAFALVEGEWGETDLLHMEVDTGNAAPQYQAARRTPFAVREEIAKQLHHMQQHGVISPSSSPWTSPVVLVRKKRWHITFLY